MGTRLSFENAKKIIEKFSYLSEENGFPASYLLISKRR